MAELSSNVLTLADAAKMRDPDGKTAAIVELLGQTNDVLSDMLWAEGNLPTGHRISQRTSLPSVYWRQINEGVSPSKSTSAQVDEQCGMLEAYSEVDQALAELNGNTASFRLAEASAFLESMSQEFTGTLFYGNTATAPEEFKGFAPRYSSLSGNYAENVINGGGTGSDNSSIWLVVWGQNTVSGIYPKGSKAGLQHEDLGLVTVETTAGIAGNRMRAYQDHWVWKCGLAVKDWRYIVRIPNIDISNLVAKSNAADLVELMIKATHRVPGFNVGKPVFYMNRSCFQMLDIQRRDDVISGGSLSYDMVDGKRVPMFRGIPIRIVDQLTESEAALT